MYGRVFVDMGLPCVPILCVGVETSGCRNCGNWLYRECVQVLNSHNSYCMMTSYNEGVELDCCNCFVVTAVLFMTVTILSNGLSSIVMKRLLFHKQHKTLEGVISIIQLITSFVEFQLPNREHETVECVLHGSFAWEVLSG